MQCDEREESWICENHTFAVKVKAEGEHGRERAEIAEKGVEGNEQCRDAEGMNVTVG